MTQGFLQLNASTRADRQQMIAALREAITTSGGWITDFKLFSNLSICLNFEIAASHMADLQAALTRPDLSLSDESEQRLAAWRNAAAGAADRDVRGTLQVTFIHSEPDLRLEVPAVPG